MGVYRIRNLIGRIRPLVLSTGILSVFVEDGSSNCRLIIRS
jgi:hypothetical protein